MNTLAYISGLFPRSSDGTPIIHFYAFCLLGAGLVCLLVANIRAHRDGFSMDFFDTIFLVAFPCGVIGSRIWYVIATYQQEFAKQPWYEIFAIWDGGLAIQGGAIGGMIGGILVVLFRRKGTPILRAMDYAVPTILIGQGLGRWGNFFNQEVFGHAVSPEAWNFLPNWLMKNMQNGDSPMLSGVTLPKGSVAAPLFLVESIVNLMFYILVAYGVKALEGKHYEDGDSSFSYFLAYGIIRMILEPLRNPKFIMGDSGSETLAKSEYRSYTMAIAFIIIGVVLIVLNHVLHLLARKGKFDKAPKFKSIFINDFEAVKLEASKETTNKAIDNEASEDGIDLSRLKAKEKEMATHDSEKTQAGH